MVVEGQSLLDLEPPHDGEAHAVREAPLLVPKSLKDLPTLAHVFRSDPLQFGELLREEPFSCARCTACLSPRSKERQDFVYDVIRGEERLPVHLKEGLDSRVVWVPGDNLGVPGACIDENHFFQP